MGRTEVEARKAFVTLMEPLAQAMRVEVDMETWGAYYRALKDVPTGLLSAAVDRLLREPRTFFPKAQEIRAAAESARSSLLALHPYQPCDVCEGSGWREVDVDGVARVERCACFRNHQKRLDALGVGKSPLMLEAGAVAD